ncbi:hypothetical protein POTOM_007559 [Populus tomentosa]|uniref:Alpha/beta-Hydrolases superfamily protein n=1 Tax=Populus tomentosa TaxID=118781 RepID=A0A8X8AAD4_POPTO|nr:hypothetical protein POTOM_007559 [Populus tomentosa]
MENSCSGELQERDMVVVQEEEAHPYAFHVSGPRNVASPNWRDLISSSWKKENYKRTVFSCFIQAVYLLEIDRQENRTEENALAPNWWRSFKYKLTQTLIDERDGSVFGAVLEWDRAAALADMVLIRPSGAPKAVLALRGTLLKGPTIRRDIEDDLRFLAWESLKGSVRFKVALEALKSVAEMYGSSNVCVAGHSLGAGFALQVGKALAKEGVYVEAHLFNPPSVSMAMSLRNIGEKAGFAWKRFKSMLPSNGETQATGDDGEKTSALGLRDKKEADKENAGPANGQVAAKLFVMSKGKQKFLEAHGLEQWWSDDGQLQQALHNSKLMSRQLKSLYTFPATQPTQRMQQ